MVQEVQNRCHRSWKTYPCGYYGDSKHNCRCTPLQIQNYRNKISGPLLDRIDIHIEVPSATRSWYLPARVSPRRPFARGPAGAVQGSAQGALQRGDAHQGTAQALPIKARRPSPVKNGHHGAEFQCPGLRPHSQGGPHHCRSGRVGADSDRARGRGDPVSAQAARVTSARIQRQGETNNHMTTERHLLESVRS